MLSAADLAYTRQTQGLTLTERAIVQHTTTVSDGMGGQLPVLTYTGDIPCRVAPMRVQAAEALVGGQLMGQLPWEITLPAGTVFDVSDRINVGGTLSGTPPNEVIDGGRWFEILAIYGAWTNETARQTLCAERDSG
jgi:hypothetical protein